MCTATLQAQVDVRNPQHGFHGLHLHEQPMDGYLLGVTRADGGKAAQIKDAWPSQLAEAYVRGDDLVATYEPHADWPYAPQIYWSADSTRRMPDAISSLRLLVSIQTDLLDTRPLFVVASQLAADELLHFVVPGSEPTEVRPIADSAPRQLEPEGEVSCLLRRLPGGRLSYAEMVPSSDFRLLTVEPEAGEGSRTEWQLFSEFLEKGVIRRARVAMAFLPRENDVELAAACCHALRSRPLPLTT
jgi:hypothetical protein